MTDHDRYEEERILKRPERKPGNHLRDLPPDDFATYRQLLDEAGRDPTKFFIPWIVVFAH